MTSVEVEILGKKYRFKSKKPEKILECAAYIEKEINSVMSSYDIVDGKDILAMTCMKLTEKIVDLTEENQQFKKEFDKLNDKISSLLGDGSSDSVKED